MSSSVFSFLEIRIFEEKLMSFNKSDGLSQIDVVTKINKLIEIILNEKDTERIEYLDRLIDYLEALDNQLDYVDKIPNWFDLSQYVINNFLSGAKYLVMFTELMHLIICLFSPTKALITILDLIEQMMECEVFDANVILNDENITWMISDQNIYGVLLLDIILKESKMVNKIIVDINEWYINSLSDMCSFNSEYCTVLLNGLYTLLSKYRNIVIEKIIESGICETFEEKICGFPKKENTILAVIMYDISLYLSNEYHLCKLLIENISLSVSRIYTKVIKECIENLFENKHESLYAIKKIYSLQDLHEAFMQLDKYDLTSRYNIVYIELLALWNCIKIPIQPSMVIHQMLCLDIDETVMLMLSSLKKKYTDEYPKELLRIEKYIYDGERYKKKSCWRSVI